MCSSEAERSFLVHEWPGRSALVSSLSLFSTRGDCTWALPFGSDPFVEVGVELRTRWSALHLEGLVEELDGRSAMPDLLQGVREVPDRSGGALRRYAGAGTADEPRVPRSLPGALAPLAGKAGVAPGCTGRPETLPRSASWTTLGAVDPTSGQPLDTPLGPRPHSLATRSCSWARPGARRGDPGPLPCKIQGPPLRPGTPPGQGRAATSGGRRGALDRSRGLRWGSRTAPSRPRGVGEPGFEVFAA